MFVEITRLLVVVVAILGGFALGGTGHGAVLGATLGALVGYVGGGALGRSLDVASGRVVKRLAPVSAARLLAGGIGALVGGGIAAMAAVPLVVLAPALIGWSAFVLLEWVGASAGYRAAAAKSEQLLALAGLSTRPLVRAAPHIGSLESEPHVLDTSTLLDGRLLRAVQAGLFDGALLVPVFVLDEVQALADGSDPVRRRRGRRALEVLEALRHHPAVELLVIEDEVVEHDEVDAKLVALAQRLRAVLVTVDEPLQRVAELRGVRCLNLDALADSLRPVHVPGEALSVVITRRGRERGQGVGFLEDGTMVVVSEAEALLGREVEARVRSHAQTALGRIVFASLARASEQGGGAPSPTGAAPSPTGAAPSPTGAAPSREQA
jgi:uncharacterized protein YacL